VHILPLEERLKILKNIMRFYKKLKQFRFEKNEEDVIKEFEIPSNLRNSKHIRK